MTTLNNNGNAIMAIWRDIAQQAFHYCALPRAITSLLQLRFWKHNAYKFLMYLERLFFAESGKTRNAIPNDDFGERLRGQHR